jgi:DNA-binding NtrC family response regulator
MTAKARVLVVDDKDTNLKLLGKILGADFDVVTAEDGTRALALLAASTFDVVVSDIRMPGADGLTVLRESKRLHPDTEVVLMTAYGSVQDAVAAMRQGAYDYLQKPFEPDEALLTVQRAAERKRLKTQARDLQSALAAAQRFEGFVAASPAMKQVADLMRRAAAVDTTVLVEGESGTGKEVVARSIHAAGARSERRFVPVNCGAIPESLMEAEFFGHVKGAFTGAVADKRGLFEEAAGGTLFLDEIGELPLAMQVKLNRALQEKAIRRVGATEEAPIDVRVVAATNVDLKAAVSAGRFREDLYYRLNIFPIRVPPLRERRDDIPALAALFLERHARKGAPPATFTPEALALLIDYDWPGNVRELENVVQRALAVADGARIDVAALPEELGSASPRGAASGARLETLSYREMLDLAKDRATRDYVVALLREVQGNVTQAAERAGIERESMHRLLKRHGVRSEDFKPR